jgi:hypothetical protein
MKCLASLLLPEPTPMTGFADRRLIVESNRNHPISCRRTPSWRQPGSAQPSYTTILR